MNKENYLEELVRQQKTAMETLNKVRFERTYLKDSAGLCTLLSDILNLANLVQKDYMATLNQRSKRD